jgi:ATP-dependent helicase HrpA
LTPSLAAPQQQQQRLPAISYPAELPVSQRRDEIAAAIRDHQVVIIAGETGSGKTTQIPKICLELGRGVTGQIGHTQPRRIAARTVADRIAAELGTETGDIVGYQVRFTDATSDGTLVKVMTDGILLAELQHDKQLRRYDTLIIDEAHERSLNIDFLLGYLKRLLPRRPDLKLIITSATIDPERFSEHFDHAPVIEVSGRTYPVEVRYRPLSDPDDPRHEPRDQIQGITDAIDELTAEGPGDILVFLSGEREIRDTAEALAGSPASLEVLPLYARLSVAEQHKIFDRHQGRRVILATNIAETSLTVPGIKYVIDPGTARISRYSNRTKVQRLPIEPVSQASANQRKGRCGRTSDGVCIRLYSEEDFTARPEYTDPEILRTSLASVILQMAALGLGGVADMPFIDPPDPRNIADGVRLLEELGALAPHRRSPSPSPDPSPSPSPSPTRLTGTGRQLARLPVDPRLGRMILEAAKNGCLSEVLIITAGLAIQDPRERPAAERDAADAQHKRFAEPGSDFLALLNLWDYLRDKQRELSGSAFRRLCRREYLHFLRVREWQDVHAQLRQSVRDLGLSPQQSRSRTAPPQPTTASDGRVPADTAQRVHMSLLAGLLSHIGTLEAAQERRGQDQRGRRRGPAEFAGARGARFSLFPDSLLARKPPQWVMAAELVETSRLWARTAAAIQPEWAEPLAGHLVRRTYSEPHWDARRGAAMASEKVTLYGLAIVAARRVSYGAVDPAAARDLFIQHALVEGDWDTRHRFFHDNRRLIDEAEDLERKARRRGLVADDAALFDFYDKRIPATVTSARHFDTWWKKQRLADPGMLTLAAADLAGPAAGQVRPEDYPASWDDLPLSYEFAPGEPDDGVTADIPLARLNQVDAGELGWQVPGLREELVTELIRLLPKQLRTAFVPVPDTARAVTPRLNPGRGDLLTALAAELERRGGVHIPRDAWNLSRLPGHLRMTFRITEGDRVLASGKDLDALRRQLRPRLEEALADTASGVTRTGLTGWTLGTLPKVFRHGQVVAYPALADAGDAVDVRLFPTQAEAAASMRRGTRRLLLLQVPSGARAVAGRLPASAKLAMSTHPYPSTAALLDDCAAAAADAVIERAGGPAWDAERFARLLEAARSELAVITATVVGDVARVLAESQQAQSRLGRTAAPAGAVADIRAQLAALVYPGFVTGTGAARLPDLVRYLRAITRRLDKIGESPDRDAERMAAVHRVSEAYRQAVADLPEEARSGADVTAIRWLIEELRVSLFAQTLGTPAPVSEKRILAAIDLLHGR